MIQVFMRRSCHIFHLAKPSNLINILTNTIIQDLQKEAARTINNSIQIKIRCFEYCAHNYSMKYIVWCHHRHFKSGETGKPQATWLGPHHWSAWHRSPSSPILQCRPVVATSWDVWERHWGESSGCSFWRKTLALFYPNENLGI